jgi:phage tail sheath gpL-like
MHDINYQAELNNENRIANGSIKVLDFEKLIGVKAQGDIEILDFEELIGLAAEGTMTVTSYTALVGKKVTVGGVELEEGALSDFEAATSNNATAASLAAAIDGADNGVSAAADGAVITIEADDVGVAGNQIYMSTDAESGLLMPETHLLGGKEEGTVTVGDDVLIQVTDFDAEVENEPTAEN